MRIVHFSDPHLYRPPASPAALRDKRALGVLNMALRRRHSFDPALLAAAVRRIPLLAPDVVVCTGDLTCVGSPEEFQAAVEALAPLAQNDGWRFIFTPGNHDAYVRDTACRKALEEAVIVLNRSEDACRNGYWELRAGPVRIMVVNEANPTAFWLSTGRLSDETVKAVQDWTSAPRRPGEKRILVGHFPVRDARGRRLPFNRRLHGDTVLASAVDAGGVDAVLCGHIHTPFIRIEENGVREVCAGSVTAAGVVSVLDYVPEDDKFRHFWVGLRRDGRVPAPAGTGFATAGILE